MSNMKFNTIQLISSYLSFNLVVWDKILKISYCGQARKYGPDSHENFRDISLGSVFQLLKLD